MIKLYDKTHKHDASREWIRERIAALISIPLVIWLVVNLIGFKHGMYTDLGDFLGHRSNAILLVLLLASFLEYSTLAVKVVLEDYISNEKLRHKLIIFIEFMGTVFFVLGVIAVICINLRVA